MKDKGFLKIALIAMIFVFIAGCAFFQTVDTPEKKALAVLKTWNSQFDDTMAIAKLCQAGECSVEQKKLVINKKKWLKLLKPVVDLYTHTVLTEGSVPEKVEDGIRLLINKLVAGLEPTADTETQVNNLINQFVAKGG